MQLDIIIIEVKIIWHEGINAIRNIHKNNHKNNCRIIWYEQI